MLSAEELNAIVKVLTTSRKIHSYFSRRKNLYPLLIEKINQIHIDKVIEYNINEAIDEEGRVKDSASKELSAIRRQIDERKQSLRKNLDRILKEVAGKDWIQEEIITTREGRMVIPIKTEYKNRVPGFIHSTSSSGATVYIEPTETLDLNNEICTLQFQEQREINKILSELTHQIRKNKDNLLNNVHVLSDIDFIQAKAKYSIEMLGDEPKIIEFGTLKLLDARHPILLQRHKRGEVVPLNIEFGDDVNTLVITGPNAGGKSVAMKTVGLLNILAQSGCHIPASPESEIRVFSDIFVDMGDEQSIENDLSSFSSHLSNLKLIIGSANRSSIALIDEIGSGTDPAEGAAIAAAVLEHLSRLNCLTIATTHHGSLKTFAFETPYFQNGAMEFNQETLQPTYRFRSGVPGSSYAIEMAERMLLPKDIVRRSKVLRGTAENKLENLIIDLEQKAQELKKNLDEASEKKNRYNALNQLYQNKIKSLEKELREIKSHAIDEAKIIVEKANTVIEKTVKEIKESSADKQIIKIARDQIKQIEEEFIQLKNELEVSENVNEAYYVGDIVELKASKSIGEIVAQQNKNHFTILIGSLKVKAHRKEIRKSDEKPTPTLRAVTYIDASLKGIKKEIDLRGMYADEAITAIEKFFDDAILSGLHRVSLIHGKGTGALRHKVNEYLKNNASIKSFRLGEWNEGGVGVTIVELV